MVTYNDNGNVRKIVIYKNLYYKLYQISHYYFNIKGDKMDAIKFMKEIKRIHETYKDCANCPLDETLDDNTICSDFIFSYPEEVIEIVKKWSKEHPIITNAMKFEEVFGCPPTPDNNEGHKYMCAPRGKRTDNCEKYDCKKCDAWWDEEWKETEHD